MEKQMNVEMKRMNYLANEIDGAYHEAALKLGLSDSGMMILYAICNNGDTCLLNDITRLSGIRKQTINSALRKLENEGIVYLENFSGRKKKVCLTDKGKKLAKDTVIRIIAIENEILTSWTEAELGLYIELTERYLSLFKEKIKEL